jgi:predicted GNAT family acetyltransferase
MKMTLLKQQVKGDWFFRPVSEGDVNALGALMLEAYRGTIDYEGEGLEEAIQEVHAVLAGAYGPFIADCSFVIEDEGKMLSASMMVMSDRVNAPLLAFSMTHPEHKRKGMAEFLLKAGINRLVGAGHRDLYLVVTEGNAGAIRLYEKLGFRQAEVQ